MKEIHFFGDKKASVLKHLNAFEPATSRTAQTLFAPNYSVTVKSSILNFFSSTTTQYLLGRHLKLSGTLYILLVIFSCFRRKKCALKRRIFNSSPIFEISLNAALLNTLHYPYNTPEHRRNAFLALNLAQG